MATSDLEASTILERLTEEHAAETQAKPDALLEYLNQATTSARIDKAVAKALLERADKALTLCWQQLEDYENYDGEVAMMHF